eukprot:NODE_3507_length_766_cov_69.093445_g2934_i0.p1 GENE.NODE_3507_length_766_cov_69.093445_g2934_i0~~NODE_3507_length_766_cov_69.093445_g2934_i0.p1  ORF type:complete len:170 (-),score=3.22 NODE_3507_length_766_cov_69.093445_g2934_i0:197-706(-)
MNSWDVQIFIKIQICELFSFIWNIILLKSALHIKRHAAAFPVVARSMLVDLDISIQNLIQRLFRTDLQNIIILRQKVDNPQIPRFLRQRADAPGLVLPPGQGEIVAPGGVWLEGRDVQVAPCWAEIPGQVGLAVDGFFGLLGVLVEPVGYVLACGFDYWLGEVVEIFLD